MACDLVPGASGEGTTSVAQHDRELDCLRHDLSQVLWAIQGRARLIASLAGADLTDQVASLLDEAAAASAMLADADRGPCDVVTVADGAWSQAVAAVGERVGEPIVCGFDPPSPAMQVDLPAHVLRRVLANLFINAIEAMTAGGGVRCELVHGDDRVRLRVADDGPGLPTTARERLFEPGATVGKGRGRGLGLAGSRSLLRRHGGDLDLVPGSGGATFELDLPLAAPADAPGRVADRLDIARGGHLLVVDDDVSVRGMLAELLAMDDHRVVLASDHDSALAAFDGGVYDAVLIDLGLAGPTGRDLAAALRSRDAAVALIMLTGWGRERELASVPASLADFTGLKPLDLPELRTLLSRAIERTAARRAGLTED